MYVYLSVCMSICLSVCLSVCMSVYLSVYLSVCLFVYLSVVLYLQDGEESVGEAEVLSGVTACRSQEMYSTGRGSVVR